MTVDKTKIYRIIHKKNLPLCIQHGLCAPNFSPSQSKQTYHNIFDSNVQEARARKQIPINPERTLHDYVPFYFCPRSVMLYTINAKGYADQRDIIHLVLYAEDIRDSGKEFLITDRNARSETALFYDNFDAIRRELDWGAIRENKWGDCYNPPFDTKARKQAEFLVYQEVPWRFAAGVAVMDTSAEDSVKSVLASFGQSNIPVKIKRDWYY